MRTKRLALALAVPAAMLLAAQSAAAAPDDPASKFSMSVEAEDGTEVATTLECEPTGGEHPRSFESCEALEETNGDPSAVNHEGQGCVLIYAPVKATMNGNWHNSEIRYTKTFPNRCVMLAEKGPIFDF